MSQSPTLIVPARAHFLICYALIADNLLRSKGFVGIEGKNFEGKSSEKYELVRTFRVCRPPFVLKSDNFAILFVSKDQAIDLSPGGEY